MFKIIGLFFADIQNLGLIMIASALSALSAPLTSLVRAYMRYIPIRIGKENLYHSFILPYLAWRNFPTIATTNFGAKLHVALPDLIQSRIYFFGFWEPQLSSFVRKVLRPGDTFVDVGANIGYFSLLASSIVGESGSVYSVEASPTIFAKLEKNVLLNQSANIKIFNAAASDHIGTLPIYMGSKENIGTTTTVMNVAERKGLVLEAQVPAAPLANIIGVENLLKARLIKIDVEGAEASVIRGVLDLLPRFNNDTEWVIEISPTGTDQNINQAKKLLENFRNAGYKLLRLENDYSIAAYIRPRRELILEELTELNEQVDVIATKRLLTFNRSVQHLY